MFLNFAWDVLIGIYVYSYLIGHQPASSTAINPDGNLTIDEMGL